MELNIDKWRLSESSTLHGPKWFSKYDKFNSSKPVDITATTILTLLTSCESFLHLWQQTDLSVGDERQSGAWVVCSCRSTKQNTSELSLQRQIVLLKKRDWREMRLTFLLGECKILQMWGNQSWSHWKHFGNPHLWRLRTLCPYSLNNYKIKTSFRNHC